MHGMVAFGYQRTQSPSCLSCAAIRSYDGRSESAGPPCNKHDAGEASLEPVLTGRAPAFKRPLPS